MVGWWYQQNVSSYPFGVHISNSNEFTSFSLIYSSKKRSLVFPSAHSNWIGEFCYITWRYKTNKDSMPRSHKVYWCSKVVYAEILHRYMVMCRLGIDEGPQISTKRICRWIFLLVHCLCHGTISFVCKWLIEQMLKKVHKSVLFDEALSLSFFRSNRLHDREVTSWRSLTWRCSKIFFEVMRNWGIIVFQKRRHTQIYEKMISSVDKYNRSDQWSHINVSRRSADHTSRLQVFFH